MSILLDKELLVSLACRCSSLGAILCPLPAGEPITDAGDRSDKMPSSIASWSRTATLAGLAQAAVQNVDALPREIAPGCWAVSLRDTRAKPEPQFAVALVFTSGWTESEKFTEAADELRQRGIDCQWTAPLRDDPAEIHRIMQWSADDLLKLTGERQLISQFSNRLSQAYEETSCLFHLARLLNVQDPRKSLEDVVHRIQEVMPFKWIAFRFLTHSAVVASLKGQTLLAGELPIPAGDLNQMADSLADLCGDSGWYPIREPDSDPLARAIGAQVLIEPIRHNGALAGLLLAGNKRGDDADMSSFEIQFIRAAADFLGICHENLARFQDQHDLFLGSLGALTMAIDAKDRYTCGHSARVSFLASLMAGELFHEPEMIETYRIAGLVHDVGKIGVPEAVLCKSGKLTDEEFAHIQRHPTVGFEILRDIPMLDKVLPGVLHHHERWDGRGYPARLKEEAIPPIARVLAVCDTFDALSSTRSYRPARPRSEALAEIKRAAGSQLEPTAVEAFLRLDLSAYDAMVADHAGAWIDRSTQAA